MHTSIDSYIIGVRFIGKSGFKLTLFVKSFRIKRIVFGIFDHDKMFVTVRCMGCWLGKYQVCTHVVSTGSHAVAWKHRGLESDFGPGGVSLCLRNGYK